MDNATFKNIFKVLHVYNLATFETVVIGISTQLQRSVKAFQK
jgi:hypothetical protein